MNTKLQEMIEEQKKVSFTDPATATDEDALGILIAHHFQWGGIEILETAFSALEDANFHSQAQQIRDLIEEVEKL